MADNTLLQGLQPANTNENQTTNATIGSGGAEAQANRVTLILRENDGSETIFSLKRSVDLNKLMVRYAEQHGVRQGHFRFIHEGKRVIAGQTPDSMEMEDGDFIEVYTEQLGG